MITLYQSLADINTTGYTGYIWMSDQQSATVVDGQVSLPTAEGSDPHIIEGRLYHKTDEKAIHINYDAGYQIQVFDLKQLKAERLPDNTPLYEVDDVKYLANKIGDYSRLTFKKLWKCQLDPYSEGRNTLVYQGMIFTGLLK